MMKMCELYIVQLFISLLFYNCSNHPLTIVEQKNGCILDTDSLFNGNYLYGMNDNYIIMRSYDRDSLIYVSTIVGDSLKTNHSFLSKGQGPYDVNLISVNVDDSLLTILDVKGGKAFLIDYRIRSQKKDWVKINLSSKIRETFTFGTSDIVWVDSVSFLFLGGQINSKNILSIYNTKTGDVSPVDYWPNDGFKGEKMIKQMVYMSNSSLYHNKRMNRFLYKSGNGQLLELFDLKGRNFKTIGYICDEFPKYKLADDGLNYKLLYPNEKNYEIIEVSVNDSFIYLMSTPGIPHMEYKKYPFYYGDFISVYDWNGNKIKEFKTDIPFCTFVVDSNNEYLYTSTIDNESGDDIIIRYEL